MYRIAILIVVGLAVLGTGDAKGTIIEFHTDGIIQEGDDFDLVEIFDDATVVMVGGTVRRFQTYETSVLNIWGGVVGGSNKHIVLAYDASTINMGGGSFDGGIFLGLDSSTVNISGGSFTGQIGVVDSSQMNIWGGIENTVLGASDSSTVNIFGENFGFTSPGTTLTGNWGDGAPFSIYIRAGVDKVNLIPEPGTLALFGLGAVPFVRKRRRLKALLYVLLFSSSVFSQVAQGVIVLPYVEDFDDREIGSAFADWDWDPVGEVLGPGSTPFGQTVPFSGNYLFLTGSEAQGTVAFLEESRSTLGFSLDFYSLPNPTYEPPGTFAGRLSFSISDSRGGRQGWIIGHIDGDMSQEPDELEVTLRVLPLDSLPGTTIEIGSIRHGEIYNLDVGLNENIVNVSITGPSTSIHYEYVIPGETLLADRIAIGQGSYPGDEYGVAIDNISVIPEPCTLALLALGASVLMRKTNGRKVLLVVLAFFWLVFSQVAHGADPSEQVLHMGSPVGFGEFDAGGYSDWYYWGSSDRHGYEYHEMLSGEWAAAIYYDGIATGNQAMWLTDYFLWPNWENFDNDFTVTSCSSWDDPSPPGNPIPPNYSAKDHANNTVTAYDTGQSVIQNGQVQITIDYEMVDLGEQGENGEGGSPLSFGTLVGADAFVYSERYVLLQTYTIKNKTASPIENLEFYQMLHGHPADPVLQHPENQINPVVFSVYDSTDHPDPLEDYEPWNDVHCEEGSIYAGNFRYDITQWNNLDDPDKHTAVDHRD